MGLKTIEWWLNGELTMCVHVLPRAWEGVPHARTKIVKGGA